jgi:branched-subunit amino acid ABC-type transport system permease component
MLFGLINGPFYAMLSLGLAVIFGLLNITDFTHGAPPRRSCSGRPSAA